VNSVVQQSIAYRRFVDITRFRIVDAKMRVEVVRVSAAHQIRVQFRNLIAQAKHELLYVFLLSLPSDKLLPSFT
jgi:hypothetical protein